MIPSSDESGCRPDSISLDAIVNHATYSRWQLCEILFIYTLIVSLEYRPKSLFNSKILVTISLASIVPLSQTKENVLAEIMMTVQ